MFMSPEPVAFDEGQSRSLPTARLDQMMVTVGALTLIYICASPTISPAMPPLNV